MKIFFVNQYEQYEVREMKSIPRIGDTIPLFYQPYPVVTRVVWLPGEFDEKLKEYDVFITVE